MVDREKKEYPSLPPDYVSLAQLQERWIQKQQEKKLRDKLEEEKKEREARTQNQDENQRWSENDGRGKMGGGSLRDVPRRRVEKDGREMGVIEVKGKGKEIALDGSENGEEKKKNKRKKKKKRYFDKKKSAEDGEKEKTSGDGCEEVEIIPRNEVKVGIPGVLSGESSRRDESHGELKGTQERVGVSKVDVMPKNRVRKEIPNVKKMAFRGTLRRNGNDGKGFDCESKKDYRVKLGEAELKLASGKKMEGEKGYDKKWRGWRDGDIGGAYHQLKEGRADILKRNEVELESENKAEDENLEVCSETGGLYGRNRNGFQGQSNNRRNKIGEHRVEGEGLNHNRVALGKKVEDDLLVVESAKNGEKGRSRNGFRRYRDWRGNTAPKLGGSTFNDRKVGDARSRVEMNVGDTRRYVSSGRFKDRWKTKQRETGMVWVKREEKPGTNAAEFGSSGNHLFVQSFTVTNVGI